MKIDCFTLVSGEEERINEGLKNRNLTPKDVVSVTWNPERGCYVVMYKKK